MLEAHALVVFLICLVLFEGAVFSGDDYDYNDALIYWDVSDVEYMSRLFKNSDFFWRY